jgi:hypothetical protein
MQSELIKPTPRNNGESITPSWASMNFWFQVLIIFHISILIFQCGFDVEDPSPPLPPIWVEKSLPEEWPEWGIDAHESRGIYLAWKANTESDIIAYNIYRASVEEYDNTTGSYLLLVHLNNKSFPEFNYVDHQVEFGRKYSYKLTAVDNGNTQSSFSDSVSYSIVHPIPFSTFSPNGLDRCLPVDRKLSWATPNTMNVENYCVTILTSSEEFVLRTQFLPGDYNSGIESWAIPASVVLQPDMVYKWRIDTGSEYYLDRETSGSESAWASFLYLDG